MIAIALQAALAITLAVSASFDALLTYAGLLLSMCAALAVAGVWVLRRREPNLARPFLTPFYPWPIVLVVSLRGMDAVEDGDGSSCHARGGGGDRRDWRGCVGCRGSSACRFG